MGFIFEFVYKVATDDEYKRSEAEFYFYPDGLLMPGISPCCGWRKPKMRKAGCLSGFHRNRRNQQYGRFNQRRRLRLLPGIL